MKKSISIWSFEGGTIEGNMDIAKKAGFDGIELALDEKGRTGLEADPADLLKIKEYADKIGLALPSVASGLYWSYPFTSADESIREKAVQIAEKQLEMAKALGADTILVVPGAVDVPWVPNFDVVSYDVAYDRALAALNRIKSKAEALKIHIGIENVWNQFLLSPLEMRDFIDKIGSPYVGAYFDVGNVVFSGRPEQWIRILGKRIRKVHFKDYRANPGGLNCFVDLLCGDVNWPQVMAAFKEIGYDDWATAEMMPVYKHYPDQLINNTSKAMKRILA